MAELTVPRAQLAPGPVAADLRPQPQLAPGLAELGKVIGNHGIAIENDRLDREMARLQVDTEKDLGQLRLEAEQIGDPDQADDFWATGTAQLRQRYASGQAENGRPRIDQRNAERFGIAFDSVANRHALALGERNVVLRQSQRAATFHDYQTVAGTEAARADPEDRADIYATFDAQTDGLVAAGIMSPEAAAKLKTGFRGQTETADALRLIDEDPEGFLMASKAGDFGNVAPDTLAGYVARANGAIAAGAKAAEVEARRVKAERLATGKAALTDMKSVLSRGKSAENEALIDDPELAQEAPYLVAELRGLRSLRDRGFYAGQLTISDMQTEILKLEAKPTLTGGEADELAALKAQQKADQAGYAADPTARARENRVPGIRLTEQPDPATTPVPDYIQALAVARRDAEFLATAGFAKGKPLPLTKPELDALKAATGPDADPARRAELGAGLVREYADDPKALAALGLDPLTLHVGGLQSFGGASPRLAQDILRGRAEIKAGNLVMPPEKDRIDAGFTVIGDLFTRVPGGDQLAKTTREAADALYALHNGGVDPANGDIDDDAYQQATHEAMGGTGTLGTDSARGGVQAYNGKPTILPQGVSVRDIDNTISALQDDMRRDWGNVGETYSVPAYDPAENAGERPAVKGRAAKAIQAASASGGLPEIDGTPLTVQDWDGIRLVAVSQNEFVLLIPGSNRLMVSDSKTGEPFRLRLDALLDAYQ